MTDASRDILIETLQWNGYLIEIRYEPECLGCCITLTSGGCSSVAANNRDWLSLSLHRPNDQRDITTQKQRDIIIKAITYGEKK